MRLPIVAFVLLFASTVVLTSDESNVNFDATFDFSKVATFTIRPAKIDSDKPEINNRLFEQQLNDVIRTSLQAKRLKEVTDRPDVFVSFSVSGRDYSTTDRRPATRIPNGLRGSRARGTVIPGTGPTAELFTEGTLVIEMAAAQTGALVWRASARNEERSAPRLARALPENAAGLLGKYPPKK